MSARIRAAFRHLDRLSDRRGLFEHADGTIRRLEHGYCTDDNARLLVVCTRDEDIGQPRRLGRSALRFVLAAQSPTGHTRNRMDATGRWTDVPGTDDCWGRSLWALGSAAASHADASVRSAALAGFVKSSAQRSRWPRAMAFAALGAADLVNAGHRDLRTRRLLADALATIGSEGSAAWPWPEPRLRYANAALAEAVIAAGHALHDQVAIHRGLSMLSWLLAVETRDGHLSLTGVDGRGPGDVAPQFDQQSIEAAAMADACWRAFTVTGQSSWLHGVEAAQRWFDGDNDSGKVMYDELSGGGYDGLEREGVNTNQGAESTLALVSTLQRSRSLVSAR